MNSARQFLRETLGRFPVKVRRGLARGAWWSIYPHSAYWRLGGNDELVENALRAHAARPGAVCWDLGAHYGIYSVGLARAVGPSGRIEAFEPDPVSFSRLQWHRRLNRLPQLHAHNVAASDATGISRLYQYGDFGSTTSHLAFEHETTERVPYREIRTVDLDSWVRDGRIRPPDFVKSDVEGHAGAALRGMRDTLAAHHPRILLAIHTAEEHEAAQTLLTGLGYRLEPLGEKTDTLRRHFGELLATVASH